jgi:hypothetical protein
MGLKTLLRPNKAQEFEGWPIGGFDDHSEHPQSEGRKDMGLLAASTRAHMCHGHPDLRSSPDCS